jgi:RHS repeat-associated protein
LKVAMSCSPFPEHAWQYVGDPVDVVTGAHVDRMLDFSVDGPFVIEWWRYYDSRWHNESRGIGFGHRHSFDHRLTCDLDGMVYTHPSGAQAWFPYLDGNERRARDNGYTLECAPKGGFFLHRHAEPTLEFDAPGDDGNALLAALHQHVGGGATLTVALRYDKYGRLSRLIGPKDTVLVVSWDHVNRIDQVALESQDGTSTRLIEYAYDDDMLIGGLDAYGQRFAFTYHADRRMASRTDRRGFTFYWDFDGDGRCVRNYGDGGLLSVTLTYKPLERQTRVVDANGGEWVYEYEPDGIISAVTDPYGERRRLDVSADGRLLAEYDELGAKTEYRFDDAGAPIARITPDGDTVLMPVPLGAPSPRSHYIPSTPIEWELGDSGDLDFDLPARGTLASRLPAIVTDALKRTDDPRRGLAMPVRDVQGVLIREEIEDGAPRKYGYNAAGGIRHVTDHDGSVWRFAHASWNHIVKEVDPLGHDTRYEYSPTEQVTAAIDPSGVRSEYAYDLKDRLVEVRRGGTIRESYRYDAAGNPTETRRADGERLLTMRYDANGHLISRTLSSGQEQSFVYDQNGRYVAAKTEHHTCTFQYDIAGRRVEDKRDGRGVEHRFDGAHLAETTVLERFRTEYESRGDGIVGIVDPTGATHRLVSHGSGVYTREFHDGFSETVQYHPRGGRVLCKVLWSAERPSLWWARTYVYTGEGDLVSVNDTQRGSTSYRYDAAHRLIESSRDEGAVDRYEYTAAGSLLRAPGLQARVGQLNRLENANGTTFEYDDRHHVERRSSAAGQWRYERDSRDQLLRAEWTDGEGGRREWRAEYDPLARRVCTQSAERGETRYYWDTDRLAAEVFADGGLRLYVYPDAGAMVPMLYVDYANVDEDPRAGRRRYILTDQRGCPERILDDRGAIIWQAKVDPYGSAHVEIGADLHQPLRFPGHWYDSETRLHYNRFRYYDPDLGRYLESDPLGLGGGRNVYAYTSNPLVKVDVLGLNCESYIYIRENPDGSRSILEVAPIPAALTGVPHQVRMTEHYHGPGSRTIILGGRETSPGVWRGGIVVEEVSRRLPDGTIVNQRLVSNEGDLIRVANHHADEVGGITEMRPDNSPHWRTAQDDSMRLETNPDGHAPLPHSNWDGEGPHVAVLKPSNGVDGSDGWDHTDKYFIRNREGYNNGRNGIEDPDRVFTNPGMSREGED